MISLEIWTGITEEMLLSQIRVKTEMVPISKVI